MTGTPHASTRSWRGIMLFLGIRVSKWQEGRKLRATAALMLGLAAGTPTGFAQQAATPAPQQNSAASNLPSEPTPTPTEPLDLRQTKRDFSRPAHSMLGLPWEVYIPTKVPAASFVNSVRLTDLV